MIFAIYAHDAETAAISLRFQAAWFISLQNYCLFSNYANNSVKNPAITP